MNESHEPEGLAEFAPESGTETTVRAKSRAVDTHACLPQNVQVSVPNDVRPSARDAAEIVIISADVKHEDWLSVFGTESVLDDAPRARSSFDEDLSSLFPDDDVDRSGGEDFVVDPFSLQAPAATYSWQHWAAPLTCAVVAVVIAVFWGMHALNPIVAPVDNVAVFSSPDVERGISSQTLRQFDTAPIVVPHVASAPREQRASGSAPAAERTMASRSSGMRIATGRAQGALSGEAMPSVQHADRFPGVDAVPLTEIAVPSVALLPVSTTGTEAAVQEYAVRRTLQSYEKAYEGLDVAATAAVWPSVDRRALARAFDTLKSQGLDFESCAISVTESNAVARCRGTLQFVRKVGNSMPLTADQEWVFKMRRLGGDWKIDEVAASRVAARASDSQ